MATLTSPSLQQLISEVRTILNESDRNNSFWKDDEITGYLNDGIRRYFTEIVQNNEGYFTTTADLDITADSETITLPTDCFQVRQLAKKISTGYLNLAYRNNVTEGWTTMGGTSSNAYTPYYYFRGNSLVLRPVPNFTETAGMRLEYIQFPDFMVNGGDTMTAQVQPVFKELIIMYGVYKCKVKETLVNGAAVHLVAQELVGSLATSFRDTIYHRSKSPTFTVPFNPESDNT